MFISSDGTLAAWSMPKLGWGVGFLRWGDMGDRPLPKHPKKALLLQPTSALWLEPWSRRRPLLFTAQSGLGVTLPINKRVCSQPTVVA